MPGYRAPLGSRIQSDSEEEEELPSFLTDLEERRWRGQQINRIKAFLNTAVEREQDLKLLLEWLTGAQESLQELETGSLESDEAEITSEWIENLDNKLGSSMADIGSCIRRLHHLCGSLFNLDVKKTKKEEAAGNKEGVWHWWREQKMDARTIKRIQDLQPPSVEAVLAEPLLGTKSASELSFMMGDMVKSLNFNKAMKMAFKFVQVGLLNLNQAFQERSKEARGHLVKMEEMASWDCRFDMAKIRVQLDNSNAKITKLEEELASAREQNEALLFRIHKMQTMPIALRSLIPKPETQGIPEELTPGLVDPQASHSSGTLSSQRSFSTTDNQSAKGSLEEEGETTEEEELEEEEFSCDPLDILEEIEKRSSDLLKDFQNSVFKIIERCVHSVSKDKDGNQPDGKGNSCNIIKLYCILQKSIRDCFNCMVTNLQYQFTNEILDLPLMDDKLHDSDFWDSVQKTPLDMLNVISKGIQQHDKTIQDTGDSLMALFGLEGSKKLSLTKGNQQDSLTFLMDQFKSLNDMGKKQMCNMRLTFECLMEMQEKMSRHEKRLPSLPLLSCPSKTPEAPSFSSFLPEMDEIEVVEEEQVNRGARKCSDLAHFPQKLVPLSGMKSVPMKNHSKCYGKTIWAEGEKKLTDSEWVKYITDVESQRTNLRLLHQAVINGNIAPDLYNLVKDLIIQTLDTVEMRLACLFQKLTKHTNLQSVRKTLNVRLLMARDMNDGRAIKDLYGYLHNLEVHESKVAQQWAAKQASIEQARNRCMAHLIFLLNQLREDYNLHLAAPVICRRQNLPQPILTLVSRKLKWSLRPGQTCIQTLPETLARPTPVSTPLPSPLPSPLQERPRPHTVRHLPNYSVREMALGQRPALWKADKTMWSMLLSSKLPSSPVYVDNFPRMLEVDINQSRINALRTLQARVSGVLDQIIMNRGDVEGDQQ